MLYTSLQIQAGLKARLSAGDDTLAGLMDEVNPLTANNPNSQLPTSPTATPLPGSSA